ncbi:MAG TPA: amidohydrolase family protein [Kribbella sp.]|uniref:metal-dependent hydrolase family protein n=1 Tax=Kribbella sp. TaxID=1871183 RepID=UPI002D778941|nr:amidohydrolase family protein [Kribbella sp.]HET6294876.1 amidohydrolase family protein [Kribbella sp.]
MTYDLILRNGIALLGEELRAEPFGSLVVRDGVIIEVTAEQVPVDGSPERELNGAFVLPGLIDCHVHFDLAAHPAPFLHWDRAPFVRSMTCFHNGLLALRAGITSVRDLGSVDRMTLDYALQVDSGELLGPRVLAAGRPITMTGGHCADYGRIADGPDAVRLAVREQLAAGAGVVKLMATGGISSPGNPGLPQLGVSELAAGIEEAHKAGVLVAAHAHAPQGIANAIEAGVDTIEHAAFATDETYKLMLNAGVTLVPTVTALNPIADGIGIPKATVEKSLKAREIYRASTAAAIAAGVRIAAGTDAGTAFNPIGGLLDELIMYVERGMTTTEALRAATVTAGTLVRRVGDDVRVGVVAVGARADLVVCERDPREGLEVLRRPAGVVLGGRPVDLGWVEDTLTETASVLVEPPA